jgi:hypothetical protein
LTWLSTGSWPNPAWRWRRAVVTGYPVGKIQPAQTSLEQAYQPA